MRNATDVVVQRAIVHRINHLKQTLTNSDVELDLNANPKLRDYFSDQVKNALEDSQTSSARFSANGSQAALTETYKILADKNSLIPSSQELARLLMTAMGTDARIKPETSNLAGCVYTASNYPGASFLALIKIDPNEALVEKVTKQKGKQIVTFDVVADVLPTKDVKLRKAALIPQKGTVKDLDLLLLDRQVTGVANFFALAFLNTTLVLDPNTSTKKFIFATESTRKVLMKAPENTAEHIGPTESDVYMRHVEAAVRRGRVNRTKFVQESPLPPKAREVLDKQLQKQFPEDNLIKFDKDYAQEFFLKKMRYRGDDGVLLEVNADRFKDLVKIMPPDPPLPDGTIITRIMLTVPNFHRIS
jgi:hypothetical protein